jgi:hypothetical protein
MVDEGATRVCRVEWTFRRQDSLWVWQGLILLEDMA